MSQQANLSAKLSALTMAAFALVALAGGFQGQAAPQFDLPAPQMSASILAE